MKLRRDAGSIPGIDPLRTAVSVAGLLLVALVGLTQTVDAEPGEVPPPNDRLHTRTEGNVRVTTAVPTGEETRAVFGIPMYRNNIQPVWVRVENLSGTPMWFLPVGLDPAYYTPLEAASRSYPWERLREVDAERPMEERAMGLLVEPGSARSGYVFTRVDEGTKSFNVDVFPHGDKPYRMTFFVPVPGLRLDHQEVDISRIYAEREVEDVDLEGLIRGLESLPCCVTDGKGTSFGDPLNLAFVGDPLDLYYAFLRAGWDETETVHRASLLKMGWSAISGGQYRYSPVSSLYVFGRRQDAALQRTRSSIHQRNHLRIWLVPMRYEGKAVWIGQISRDIGVRFTMKTITTHKIDPAVDETREFLVEDLAYTQSLAKFGYVAGVGAATFEEPRGNLTGDPYFTDGLRAVMWISSEPVPLDEIQIMDRGAIPLEATTSGHLEH